MSDENEKGDGEALPAHAPEQRFGEAPGLTQVLFVSQIDTVATVGGGRPRFEAAEKIVVDGLLAPRFRGCVGGVGSSCGRVEASRKRLGPNRVVVDPKYYLGPEVEECGHD